MHRFALALVLASCAGPVAEVRPDPQGGRAAWIAALQSGDAGRTWALLADDARGQFQDRAAFDVWYRRHAADLLVDVLGTSGPPLEVVHLSAGVDVVRAEGGWRVRRSLLDGPARAPVDALKRLREALRATVADGRDVWASAPAGALARMSALLDAAIARGVPDGQTRVDLGQGASVTLVKERGGWLVDGVVLPK